MHDTELLYGAAQDTERTPALKIATVAPFLSAPLVQSLQATMCGVGALQLAGAMPAEVATGGLLADVCEAVRVAVERLYQESYKKCVTLACARSRPSMFWNFPPAAEELIHAVSSHLLTFVRNRITPSIDRLHVVQQLSSDSERLQRPSRPPMRI